MLCERCGDEEAIGYSLQEELIGRDCLEKLNQPEIHLRITDHIEKNTLKRYIKRYGVNQWR